MRGNDLLMGTADVVVMDSLTGNLMMKLFSSYTTGGQYEATGYGYGPGIGEGYDKLVMIVSRASGAPVIAGAMEYAASLIAGDWKAVAAKEYEAARRAGLDELLAKNTPAGQETAEEVTCPPKEVVTAAIPGIEVMDLDEAVKTAEKEKKPESTTQRGAPCAESALWKRWLVPLQSCPGRPGRGFPVTGGHKRQVVPLCLFTTRRTGGLRLPPSGPPALIETAR